VKPNISFRLFVATASLSFLIGKVQLQQIADQGHGPRYLSIVDLLSALV
jgi:hypothetical protein